MKSEIVFDGRLGSDRADTIRDELAAAAPDLEIEGSQVRSIGALCAQEFYRARATRIESGGTWKLEASDEMRADLVLLGLAEILENLGDDV